MPAKESFCFLTLTVVWRDLRLKNVRLIEGELCTPCMQLGIKADSMPPRLSGKISAKQNNSQECCGATSVVLQELLNKSFTEVKDEGPPQSYHFYNRYAEEKCRDNRSMPVAFMKDIDHRGMIGDAGTLHWVQNNEKRLIHGLTYNNGRIIIEKPGMYFINSHISFQNVHNKKFSSDNVQVDDSTDHNVTSHFIHHENGTHDTRILENYNSRCPSFDSHGCKTSNLGGVFEFKKDDTLRVKTTHPWHVKDHSNEFHIYMINGLGQPS